MTTDVESTWTVRRIAAHALFRLYWVAAVADSVTAGMWLAMLLRIASGASTPAAGAVVIAAGIVPALVLAPVGGVLADRLGHGRTVLLTAGLRALVLLAWLVAIPSSSAGTHTLLVLGLIGFVFNGIGGLHEPAVNTYLASFLPPQAQPAARSVEATGQRIAQLVGIVVGGTLMGTAGGLRVVAVLTVVAAAIATLLYGYVYLHAGEDRTSSSAREQVTKELFRQRFTQGVRIAREHPVIRHTLVAQLVASGLIEGAVVAGIPFIVHHHHLPEYVFTASLAAFFAGLFAGSVILGAIVTRVEHMPRAALRAFGGAGLAMIAIGAVGAACWPATVALSAIAGGLMAFGGPGLTGWTMRQLQTQAEEQGKAVMGRFGAVVAIAKNSDQLGVLLVGAGATAVGVAPAIVAAGIALVVLMSAMLRSGQVVQA